MSIFTKVMNAAEVALDSYIEKAKREVAQNEYEDRKGLVEIGFMEEQQHGYKEKRGLVSAGVLKNMARKDSIIAAIINTRLSQVGQFAKVQKDRYSAGWEIVPITPIDIDPEDKLKLTDPTLGEDEKAQLQFEMDEKRQKLKETYKTESEEIKEFIMHCGMPSEETDTTHLRWDFEKWLKVIIQDRLIYNYSATELIPTKDGSKIHHFYPVSAGTIKYVATQAKDNFNKLIVPEGDDKEHYEKRFDKEKQFKYVQVVRGKIVAAFTEDELIFEPAIPTVDPEDNGYSPGELEALIQIVTAHLYAEAHNRNFFTQGLGTKGILHIKGDNISQGQLEAFKRQWFNQVSNTRNAFRPPIIGMADDVRWVSLAQTNREMEFENWMNYLIKITCAIYQIDPSEINFDIAKGQSSTLQEASNEDKLKASKDKGLRPLLDYVENIINNHILRYWNPEYAKKYQFKFVGVESESKRQEIDRLEKETRVFKTLNEARIEMGLEPIEDGDVVLNATFTQYKAQKQMQNQQQPGMDQMSTGDGESEEAQTPSKDEGPSEMDKDLELLQSAVESATSHKDAQETKQSMEKQEDTKKSTIVEYYIKE